MLRQHCAELRRILDWQQCCCQILIFDSASRAKKGPPNKVMKDTTFDPRLNMCVSIVLVYIISVIYNVWDSQTTDSTSLFQAFFKGGLVVAGSSQIPEFDSWNHFATDPGAVIRSVASRGAGRGDATPVPSQSCTCLTSQQDFILYNLKFVALYTIYPCVRRCIVIMMMMTIIMTILIHNRNPWALIKRQDKLRADQLVWIRRKRSPVSASCFGKKCSRIPCSSRSADEILLALHQRRSYGQVQMKSVVCFTIFSKKSSSDVFAAV